MCYVFISVFKNMWQIDIFAFLCISLHLYAWGFYAHGNTGGTVALIHYLAGHI